ncbi:hypothetical protein [Tenacibaculum sp. SG-28]|uniref:hypothetical protein n=1 Tax=Tenacibaculum sp. SG-28 TaxID=754426 RepID=UPI0013048245
MTKIYGFPSSLNYFRWYTPLAQNLYSHRLMLYFYTEATLSAIQYRKLNRIAKAMFLVAVANEFSRD